MDEPRIARIGDGLYAQVVDYRLLPDHCTSASHEGQSASCPCRPLVDQMRSVRILDTRSDLGTRAECKDQHAYAPWLSGLFGARELLLSRCAYCTAVEVRDRSFDILPGLGSGSGTPRRRSDVLGWYSGSRPSGRTFH